MNKLLVLLVGLVLFGGAFAIAATPGTELNSFISKTLTENMQLKMQLARCEANTMQPIATPKIIVVEDPVVVEGPEEEVVEEMIGVTWKANVPQENVERLLTTEMSGGRFWTAVNYGLEGCWTPNNWCNEYDFNHDGVVNKQDHRSF